MLQSHWSKAQHTGPQQGLAGQHQATLHPTQPPEPVEKQLHQVTGHNSAEQTALRGPVLAQPTSPWPGPGGLQDHVWSWLGHTESKTQPGLWHPSTESFGFVFWVGWFFFFLFQHSSAWLQFSEEQIGTFIGHSFLLQPAAA